MIASFRSGSRFGLWSAALVAVFALVTLTDANAGERQRMKMRVPISPEAKVWMERLDEPVTNLEMKNATLDEILAKITASTGVTLKVSEDAITDETRKARFDLKANAVPAHIVLMESLHSVDLGLDFTEAGPTVIAPKFERRVMRHPDAEGAAMEDRVIMMRRAEHPAKEGEERAIGRSVVTIDEDGATRRKVTFRAEGQEGAGTLEIEVRKE